MSKIDLASYISSIAASPLAPWAGEPPWSITTRAAAIVLDLIGHLDLTAFRLADRVAIHRTAIVESGAILKGPAVIGARCFVAAGAYLRDGTWLDQDCIVGPGTELKSSFMSRGSKLAHFNFVGDSLLGCGVNLEAGSIVANYRNERVEKEIKVRQGSALLGTGVEKFGALIGDQVRIGANAVVAPGSLIPAGFVLGRLALFDQEAALNSPQPSSIAST